jgi:hypothetical protein
MASTIRIHLTQRSGILAVPREKERYGVDTALAPDGIVARHAESVNAGH